jgi:hypothetical protein
MCRAMVLHAPLAEVGEEMEEPEDLDELWRLAFQEVEGDLRCLVSIARAAGVAAQEVAEAEEAIRAPVTHTEMGRLRGLQFRKDAAIALATRLARAGHRSAVIAEWAAVDRQVRQRLA